MKMIIGQEVRKGQEARFREGPDGPIVYGSFDYECSKYGARYRPESLHELDCLRAGLNPLTTTSPELERARKVKEDIWKAHDPKTGRYDIITIPPKELEWYKEKKNSALRPKLEDLCAERGLDQAKITSGYALECARFGMDPTRTTVDDLKRAGSLIYNPTDEIKGPLF